MIKFIHSLFPMSKGALLAVSFVGAAGTYQAVLMNQSMAEIKTLQRETVDTIHSIDKRLTVVEAQLDGTIVFRSQQADLDSSYSTPRKVKF